MLTIEILVIGSKALVEETGFGALLELKRKLHLAGYFPQRITFLSDEMMSLIGELDRASKENRLILILAEMGTQPKDPGRQLAAYLSKSPFILDRKLAEELRQRFKDLKEPELYALIPKACKTLKQWSTPNQGLFFEDKTCHYFFIPFEAKELIEGALLTHLKERFFFERLISKTCYARGLSKEESERLEEELQLLYPLLRVKGYVEGANSCMRFSLAGEPDEVSFRSLEEAVKEFERRTGSHFIDDPQGMIAKALHRKLLKSGKKLMLAESCTGGRIASEIVKNPDASRYFDGALITYSNALKKELLGVESIEAFGAVSQETVEEMVAGILKRFPVDLALAVTGIAGPTGGGFDKPVGLVWIACGKRGEAPLSRRFLFQGTREEVIEKASEEALLLLLEVVF